MKPDTESIINSIFLIMIVSLIFLLIFQDCIKEKDIKQEYQELVKKNLEDKYSKFYANLCKGTNKEINCIMKATNTIYKYVKDQERKEIRTPSQYVKLGGNCKDSAIFYATIFKRMNYTINFEFPIPQHVNIIISKKLNNNTYKYCIIEGNTANCYEVII